MNYQPTPPPNEFRALTEYIARELRRIADSMGTTAQLDVLHAEPPLAVDGMMVYADGTDWDPGSGAGFYGRESGAWVKL